MALYLGPQKRALFSQLCVPAVTFVLQWCPLHVMNACWWSRRVAQFVLNLGTRWG
jgi:hypothetical protein